MSNLNLHKAKKEKNDEFYTKLEDIEAEISHYNLKGKSVYSPCDDFRWSNFTKYFTTNFSDLGIKKYVCTNYDIGEGAYKYEYDGNNTTITKLEGNGDFRSEECTSIMKECDIVVTNPPFSLFRAFVGQIMDLGKKFLIIGNQNAITYKEFFPYIKNGKVWLGRTLFTEKMPFFKVPNDYPLENDRFEKRADGLYKQVNAICWFTNVYNQNNKELLTAIDKYSNESYPKYDNYDAIEVSRMEHLPKDFNGIMGIPITGLKYLWDDGTLHIEIDDKVVQFEIVKFRKGNDDKDLAINGKTPYFRILIQRKHKW